VSYYNEKFDRSIPRDAGIDIFDPALDGHQILDRLNTPVATCRFCACSLSAHPWKSVRNPKVENYDYVAG
jgi:hypothetical protein